MAQLYSSSRWIMDLGGGCLAYNDVVFSNVTVFR